MMCSENLDSSYCDGEVNKLAKRTPATAGEDRGGELVWPVLIYLKGVLL
jgi:hypothetical protein